MPFLATYCVKCHNAERSEAELDLTRYTSAAALGEHFRQWETVVVFLKKGEMPPAKAKQPTSDERAADSRDDREAAGRRSQETGGRSGCGAAAQAEQCGVQLHDPRSDGRGHSAGGVVSRRSGVGRGVQQYGRSPRHVLRACSRSITPPRNTWPNTWC